MVSASTCSESCIACLASHAVQFARHVSAVVISKSFMERQRLVVGLENLEENLKKKTGENKSQLRLADFNDCSIVQ